MIPEVVILVTASLILIGAGCLALGWFAHSLWRGRRPRVVQVPAHPPMAPLLRPDTHGRPLDETEARLIDSWEHWIAYNDPDFKKAFEGKGKR